MCHFFRKKITYIFSLKSLTKFLSQTSIKIQKLRNGCNQSVFSFISLFKKKFWNNHLVIYHRAEMISQLFDYSINRTFVFIRSFKSFLRKNAKQIHCFQVYLWEFVLYFVFYDNKLSISGFWAVSPTKPVVWMSNLALGNHDRRFIYHLLYGPSD